MVGVLQHSFCSIIMNLCNRKSSLITVLDASTHIDHHCRAFPQGQWNFSLSSVYSSECFPGTAAAACIVLFPTEYLFQPSLTGLVSLELCFSSSSLTIMTTTSPILPGSTDDLMVYDDDDQRNLNPDDDDQLGDEVVFESEVAVKAGEKINVVEKVVAEVDAASTISVSAASTIPVSATTITDVEITFSQAVAELKNAKPKADKVVIQEPEQGTTTTIPTTTIHVPKPPHDKGKGIMIEVPMVEQGKAQQIEEANIAWDDVQAKIEQRRKHFAAKKAEEKRNRPPKRAQQRNIMCTYLKNMEGWKPKSLKNKSFANIQELFDKAMKRVNTFVDYRTELVEESSKKAETELEENLMKAEAEVLEGSSKRAGTELEQEVTKKQKVDDVQETAEVDND
ncbi:hypothetical protein Tco_1440532 [Tanacetum coccineum]